MAKYPVDRKVLEESKIVSVMDIETTGYSPKMGASIIEVGGVLVDVDAKKVVCKFSQFVHPIFNNGKIPSKITKLTGITEKDVVDASEPEEVLNDLFQFIGPYPVVFHNAIFDWDRFLVPGFLKIGKHVENSVIDTVRMSRLLHKDMKEHNLAALCNYYGFPIEGHHRAWIDCKYTASLFLKMRDEILADQTLGVLNKKSKNAVEQLDMRTFKVLKINRWSKGSENRLYIYTSVGVFCFDGKRQLWTISELRTSCNVDIDLCVTAILQTLRCSSGPDLMKKNIA